MKKKNSSYITEKELKEISKDKDAVFMDELSLFGTNYISIFGLPKITRKDIEKLKDRLGRVKYPNFDIKIISERPTNI